MARVGRQREIRAIAAKGKWGLEPEKGFRDRELFLGLLEPIKGCSLLWIFAVSFYFDLLTVDFVFWRNKGILTGFSGELF